MTARIAMRFLTNGLRSNYYISRRFLSDKSNECKCQVSSEVIKRCLEERKKDLLIQEMTSCQTSKKYGVKWESYDIEMAQKSEKTCKAVHVFKNSLYIYCFKKTMLR
jgi:hypothetical protein